MSKNLNHYAKRLEELKDYERFAEARNALIRGLGIDNLAIQISRLTDEVKALKSPGFEPGKEGKLTVDMKVSDVEVEVKRIPVRVEEDTYNAFDEIRILERQGTQFVERS